MASVSFSHWQPSRQRRERWAFHLPASARAALKLGAGLLVFLAVVEAALRLTESYFERPMSAAGRTARLPVGALVGGKTVNALGYADDEFRAAVPPGTTRIALLGGRATLAGDDATNLVAQLEQLLPGVEIDHFGVPDGNPRRYDAQLRADVLKFNPDFVVVCLSPADDVAATAAAPSMYEMRLWHLADNWFNAGSPEWDPTRVLARLTERLDYETYVRRRTAAALICRSGSDADAADRWQAAQAGMTRMADRCRERNVGFGVVFAPSEFQLNPTLAESLRRRAGVEADRFDVDLPQRRWTALADHLELPSLDLLPTFRAASAILYEPSSPDWNAAGRTLAAQTTARWLQNRLDNSVAVSGAQ